MADALDFVFEPKSNCVVSAWHVLKVGHMKISKPVKKLSSA
jgi:hypothetical protein